MSNSRRWAPPVSPRDEVAEILANVALNVFTNYFNKAAQTVIDFPRVESIRKAA